MNSKKNFLLSLSLLISGAANSAVGQEGDPSLQGLFPIPEDVRKILDQRCVFCHGEMIDGEAEIREDLDLSTEAAIRATLFDLETLQSQIEEDEMPQEAKLSFRLRRRPEMQERLRELKAAYEESDEKAKLLDWIKGATK